MANSLSRQSVPSTITVAHAARRTSSQTITRARFVPLGTLVMAAQHGHDVSPASTPTVASCSATSAALMISTHSMEPTSAQLAALVLSRLVARRSRAQRVQLVLPDTAVTVRASRRFAKLVTSLQVVTRSAALVVLIIGTALQVPSRARHAKRGTTLRGAQKPHALLVCRSRASVSTGSLSRKRSARCQTNAARATLRTS